MVVVLIGHSEDPHVEEVRHWLNRQHVDTVVYDPRNTAHCFSVSTPGTNGGRFSVGVNNRPLAPEEVTAVWLRFKPQRIVSSSGTEFIDAARFVDAEWTALIRGLAVLWAHADWVNPANTGSWSKLQQLQLAMDCGFSVPDTVITNDPNEVQDLARRHGSCVYKALTAPDFADGTFVWTTRLDLEQVIGFSDNIKRAPGIFQQEIRKKYELRVTVVGRELFSARIITPDADVVDWRLTEHQNCVSSFELDDSTSMSLLLFHEKAGLRYAAYDLIVTPDDEIIFLECNRGGQYSWLETQLALPISRAVASLLAANE